MEQRVSPDEYAQKKAKVAKSANKFFQDIHQITLGRKLNDE